ncbi:MAG: HAMP domain-containing protein, partial [Candidatus Latescibacteria bacterium]|nr:HAMP domain-containing protein [Candidatus Latescibacterota bacterium]
MPAPLPSVRPTRGFSLRDRLLLFTLGIVVVLLGLSMGIIDAFVRSQVRAEITEELVTTGAVFERFLVLRAGWLRKQSHVVAEDPRFSASFDLPEADPEALARTVLGVSRRFQSILGSELFITTDPQGTALAQLELSRPKEVEQRRFEDGRQLWTVDGVDYAVRSADVAATTITVGRIADAGQRPPAPDELATAVAEVTSHLAAESEDGDLVAQLLELFVADLAMLSDAEGRPLDIIARRIDSGRDLSAWPSVRQGLSGRPDARLRIEGRRLFHVDVVPVWSPDRLVGTLITGLEINDALAGELRDMTRSHVSFFDHEGRVIASTWIGAARDSLEFQLPARDAEALPFETVVDGETYLSRIETFGLRQGDDDGQAIRYLTQRSLDRAFAFLDALEETLLGVGALVLALATALSFLGARRITRPVGALVEGTRRLATGDLQHRIVDRSRSELGELAESFNDMAGALSRSREALEESERAYRDLFDNAQDLVFTCDLQHRILTVNKAGLAFLGYTFDQLRGRPLLDLIAPAQRERVGESMQAVPPGTSRPLVEAAFLRQGDSEA